MPIINGQGRIGVRVQVPLLLDTYTGAAAAYSLRKLSNTYNGPAIRVRRSSNNAELNIGFNSDGTLDTTTLLSFVGAGNGFVVTWFDQSGSNINWTWWQAVTQAKIVSNGVVETLNGKPCVNTSGINVFYRPNNAVAGYTFIDYQTLYAIGKVDSNSNNILLSHDDSYEKVFLNSSGNFVFQKHDFGTPYPGSPMIGGREFTLSGPSTNPYMLYMNMRNSNLYASYNGNSETLLGAWGSAMRTTRLFYGYGYYQGKLNELVLWSGDKSANKVAIESNMNSYYSIYNPMDSDATAFITAAGITNSTQQSAVNTLVTSLKSAGLWTKMKAIYPFVGGTASAHKFNLKDPRDLDAAYRLVFNGGWTHSSTGAQPNGTNGYADTKLAPSSALALNSASFGFYGYKSSAEKSYQMGTEGGFGVGSSSLAVTYFDNFNANPRFVSGLNGGGVPNGTNTTISGMYMLSRASANSIVAVKNTTTLTTGTSAAAGLSSQPLYIGSYNAQGWPSSYSNTDFRTAYISDGLTEAEMSTLYTAVQAFQTTLGRQVA